MCCGENIALNRAQDARRGPRLGLGVIQLCLGHRLLPGFHFFCPGSAGSGRQHAAAGGRRNCRSKVQVPIICTAKMYACMPSATVIRSLVDIILVTARSHSKNTARTYTMKTVMADLPIPIGFWQLRSL